MLIFSAISYSSFFVLAGLVVLKCILQIYKYLDRKFGSGVESREKNSYKKIDSFVTRAIFLIFIVKIGFIFIEASFLEAYDSIAERGEMECLAFIYLYAWLAYLVMGGFWVIDKKIGKIIPVTGTIAGSIGILSVAIYIVPLILLAPQVFFAYHLAKFHSSKQVVER